jgi:cyclic pyranopterin phosphate synthase
MTALESGAAETAPAPRPPLLADGFGRRFRYLRLSVTEVCNFRCAYCLPDGYQKSAAPPLFLEIAEIARLVAGFAALGVTKVRLSGGEPSVRRDLTEIIGVVAATPGVEKVALTTNGWGLGQKVRDWREAGLTHLNVSVDTLDPALFARITGHDRLPEIMAGVDAALGLGLGAVKLNAVLLRDTAETAFEQFADWLRDRPATVRFIELMRTLDNVAYFEDQHVRAGRLEAWLAARGWTRTPRLADDGPAVEYRHPDYAGRFGIIAPYAADFCDGCNRLRVTSRGLLRLCLFGEGGVNLRDLLADDVEPERLERRILDALPTKARGHELMLARSGDLRRMADVGG